MNEALENGVMDALDKYEAKITAETKRPKRVKMGEIKVYGGGYLIYRDLTARHKDKCYLLYHYWSDYEPSEHKMKKHRKLVDRHYDIHGCLADIMEEI
jgi:hypothetical protein